MQTTFKKSQPEIDEIFKHLHEHPEISWKEYNTTRFIQKYLKESGCRVKTFDDCTGIVGEIDEGDLTVAVRADMDALWQNTNGKFCANHSCGHDAHMTMVLGVLFALKRLPHPPNGKIKFIFQPAEEKGSGALKMIEKKIVDDVDYLYGVHLRPVQEIKNGKASPSIIHGATALIEGEIVGIDSHGARPHLGTNSIEIGAEIVQKLNCIHLNPMVPHSVKITKFTAGGESANVIPGSALFSLDLRAQTNEMMSDLMNKVKRAIKATADYYNVQIKLTDKSNVAAAKVSPQAEKIMSVSIQDVLGKDNLEKPLLTPGSDDFNFYALKRPSIKATMLGLGCGLKPGLHSPNMTFDHRAIKNGIEILTLAVLKTLKKETEV